MIQRRDFQQGEIFHIYNRGNHREMIFRDNPDRRLFLSKLDQMCDSYGASVLTYCLMDNHFHLLLRQDSWRPLSQLMRALVTGYVRSHNSKYGLVGRLFQGRYQASRIWNDDQLAWKSRYIHRNPAKFTDYRTYRWSSTRQFLNGNPGMCDTEPVLAVFRGSRDSYATYLEDDSRTVLEAVGLGEARAAKVNEIPYANYANRKTARSEETGAGMG